MAESANSDILQLKAEINMLKEELRAKRKLLKQHQSKQCKYTKEYSFTSAEILRYSRQMIMPNVTINGQDMLKRGKVLVVGVGGLGCPAALYLASAGVGEITLVDYDTIELTNLHRQILHTEYDTGDPKVLSAYDKLRAINSSVKIIPLIEHVSSEKLQELVQNKMYDVVLDCSDNVATRYLINDICVINNIPLVSGSALQMEGQLTVYHYNDGPCYRCLFPKPPPPETVTNCGDGGVLGPIPGVIGVLQALETMKILMKAPDVLAGRLLIFDGATTVFRNIKLRPRNDKCEVCGLNPSIRKPIDYEQFCGTSAHDKVVNISVLDPKEELAVQELIKNPKNVIIDVRPELEYKMCSLPNTINFPYSDIIKDCNKVVDYIEKNIKNGERVCFLCRRGNDSQRAILYLKDKFNVSNIKLYNMKGGLHAYSKYVDSTFPAY